MTGKIVKAHTPGPDGDKARQEAKKRLEAQEAIKKLQDAGCLKPDSPEQEPEPLG